MMRKETLPRFPKRCTRTCSASRSISREHTMQIVLKDSAAFKHATYALYLLESFVRTPDCFMHMSRAVFVWLYSRVWSWPDRTVSRMTRWFPDVGNFDKEDDERELWSSKMMKDEIVRSCVRHVPCDMLLTYCSVLRITYRSKNSGVRIYMYHWD